MTIATYTITEARSKYLHFSPAYYTDGVRVLVQTSTQFQSLADLKGMTVGTVVGSSCADVLVAQMEQDGILPVSDFSSFDASSYTGGLHFYVGNDYAELIRLLETGEIDAVCGNNSHLYTYVTSDRRFLSGMINEEDYGVALLPDSPLADQVDALITAWLADGTIQALQDKWMLND